MAWNLIEAGTSVLGRQSLNCRLVASQYGCLLLPLIPVSQQRFFGVVSIEFLNTPLTGVLAQNQIVKIWTKSAIARNLDPFNDADLFMFWRVAGIDWEAYRFD